jgi:hypothetical protein
VTSHSLTTGQSISAAKASGSGKGKGEVVKWEKIVKPSSADGSVGGTILYLIYKVGRRGIWNRKPYSQEIGSFSRGHDLTRR